jgi:hypothetical protein
MRKALSHKTHENPEEIAKKRRKIKMKICHDKKKRKKEWDLDLVLDQDVSDF